MRCILIAVCTFFALLCEPLHARDLDSLLNSLDESIAREQEFIDAKESHIGIMKEMLEGQVSDETRYHICLNIAGEYERYQCDSAMFYAQHASELARASADRILLNSADICVASIASKAGFFDICLETLDGIDKGLLQDFQLERYYSSYYECLVLLDEFRNGFGLDRMERNLEDCKSSIRDASARGLISPYFNAKVEALDGLRNGDWPASEKILLDIIPHVNPNSPEMASVASLLSGVYLASGNVLKQKEYLAVSAISDVESCVKENTSLRLLASILYDEGDFERANRYINKSLADANFYNSRLRNIQVSKVLPIIEGAYLQEINRQSRKLFVSIVLISLLTLLIMTGAFLLIIQNRKLSLAGKTAEIANERLNRLNAALQESVERERQSNAGLIEANHIKELFIGNFLDICTEYIDKLHKFKIKVNKKLKAGQTSDLLRITSNAEPSSQEKKELYASFDRAFLTIYPTFVDEFNALLREGERYSIDEMELNQELRIYALIKLGITDVQKIQTFLNCSARTVYNYRSVVRRRAIDQNSDFDVQVRGLCQVS